MLRWTKSVTIKVHFCTIFYVINTFTINMSIKNQFCARTISWANPSLGDTTKNITPWFSWTQWTLKNHRKHLNKYFPKFVFMTTFIRFHRFWNFNTIRNIVYSMFLVIAFIKSFKNITMVHLLECFYHKHKFETLFEIFLGVFFLR